MIRLEITICEAEQGIQARTHVVKEKTTELEKLFATAIETTTACVLANLVFVDHSTVKMNQAGFMDDFCKMVVK